MKKQLSTKKYLGISAGIFCILLVAVFVVLFILEKEKEKLRVISNDLSIANKEDVVTLKRAIRNYEESADSIENVLVNRDDIFIFISDVERLAKESGAVVAIQNIDLFDVLKNGEMVRTGGEEVVERTHGKFIMNVRVDGDWEAVSLFLLKMENIPKHALIDSFKLSSIFDPKTNTQTWSGNFNIITTTN